MKPIRNTATECFTLIEMVVVIALCAVLAAALVPVLISARDDARTIACAADLDRLGSAFNVISAGESGYFTNAFYNVTQLADGRWWIGLRNFWDRPDPLVQMPLEPTFLCPSARGYVRVVAGVQAGRPMFFSTTYAHNVEMPIIARNIARVPEPCNRVILYDGDPAAVVGIWDHNPYWPNATITPRHRGKANFLFLDGHVEPRGDFRADPFHGCPRAQTAQMPDMPISAGHELPGRSEWVVLADVDVHPESNNVGNRGQAVECKITLPAGVGASVNLSTVYLTGAAGQPFTSPLAAVPPMRQSVGENGELICHVKFDRQALYAELVKGDYFGRAVPMRVVGELTNGRPFDGVDENCVFDPPRGR